jgi:phage gp36-like protein
MYCTQDDLIKRFGEEELIDLTDLTNTGSVDADRVSERIAEATSFINGYLQGRIQLPLTDVPAVIERFACDITRYHLYINGRPDEVEANYKSAVAYLRDVAAGKVSLGVDATQEAPAPAANSVLMESDGRVFGRRTSKDFI